MSRAERPQPAPTHETAPFWQGAERGELVLPRCRTCGRLHYPPPPRCVNCLTETLEWTRLSGRGQLVGWSTVHIGLSQGIEPPFVVGEVELVEQVGLVIAALVVGAAPESLRLGANMTVGFAPGGPGFAYPQFAPLAAGAGLGGDVGDRR
jgi:uncharacterized OB-fold protein